MDERAGKAIDAVAQRNEHQRWEGLHRPSPEMETAALWGHRAQAFESQAQGASTEQAEVLRERAANNVEDMLGMIERTDESGTRARNDEDRRFDIAPPECEPEAHALLECLDEALVKGRRVEVEHIADTLGAIKAGDPRSAREALLAMPAGKETRDAIETVLDASLESDPGRRKAWNETLAKVRGHAERVHRALRRSPHVEVAFTRTRALVEAGTRIARERKARGVTVCPANTGALEDPMTGTTVVEQAASRPNMIGASGRAQLVEAAQDVLGMNEGEARAAVGTGRGSEALPGGGAFVRDDLETEARNALRAEVVDNHWREGGFSSADWSREPARERLANAMETLGVSRSEAVVLERAAAGRCIEAPHRSCTARVREAMLETSGYPHIAETERTVRCARTALGAVAQAQAWGEREGPQTKRALKALAQSVRTAWTGRADGTIGAVPKARFDAALSALEAEPPAADPRGGDTRAPGWTRETVRQALRDGADTAQQVEHWRAALAGHPRAERER